MKPHWNWEGYAWITWLLAFAALEAIGLICRPTKGMTLTYFIENFIPRAVLAMFFGWLICHFFAEKKAKG